MVIRVHYVNVVSVDLAFNKLTLARCGCNYHAKLWENRLCCVGILAMKTCTLSVSPHKNKDTNENIFHSIAYPVNAPLISTKKLVFQKLVPFWTVWNIVINYCDLGGRFWRSGLSQCTALRTRGPRIKSWWNHLKILWGLNQLVIAVLSEGTGEFKLGIWHRN